MTRTILFQSDLAALVKDLAGAGTRVIAPVLAGQPPDRTEYQPIRGIEAAALGRELPRRSLKEFFRPSVGEETPCAPQVVLGCRPCDAAAIDNLDDLMGWDYSDELWRGHRRATTIVTIACPGDDGACFCTAVGLGPDSTKGSDAILVPLDGGAGPTPTELRIADLLGRCVDVFLHDCEPYQGAADLEPDPDPVSRPKAPPVGYLAEAVTAKGWALLEGRGKPLTDPADLAAAEGFVRAARERATRTLATFGLRAGGRIARNVEAELGIAAADGGELVPGALSQVRSTGVGSLPDWLARNFDHPLWKSFPARCLGCGVCEAICAASPCFDPVDDRPWAGSPQRTRTDRFRQRVMHRFSIHPRRFDVMLCTGCGRCARTCDAGIRLPEILGKLVAIAGGDTRDGGSRP